MKRKPSPVWSCWILGAALATLLGPASHAQSSPRMDSRLNLALTFQSVYSGRAYSGGNFFTQGGAAELDARLCRRLRLVLDVTGEHAGTATTGGVPLSYISAVIGPRYVISQTKHTSAFLEIMAGAISAFGSRFPTSSGLPPNAPTSANSLALLAGGGLDLRLRHRLSFRVLQVDWLYTQLPNASSSRENNLRIGAGINLRLGR